jgi:DNA-binding transcriptional MerR regulator
MGPDGSTVNPIVTIGSSMNINGPVSIGELANITATKVVTIRYYERIGLLPSPPRTSGNYRVYDRKQVSRLSFIRRCRDLGFSLEQIRDLMRLSSRKDQNCTEVDRLAAEHLASVKTKIADLKRLAAELQRINNCCEGGGRIADCRIIEALSP